MNIKDLPLISGDKLYGHANRLRTDVISILQELSMRPEPLLQIRIFQIPILVANSPEVIRETLVENARSVEKSFGMRASLYPLAGNGLFTSEAKIWKPQRKLMAPLFQPSYLSDYVPTMYECAARVADKLQDGEVINISTEMTRVTMNVAGQTLFGADTFDESDDLGKALNICLTYIGENTSSPRFVLQAFLISLWRELKGVPEKIQERVETMLFDPPRIPTAENREYQEALDLLNRKALQMIADRRREGLERKDLLTKLLGAQDEDTGRMSDKQVRDETMTLFIAGHETTANILSWCWHLLTKNPEAYRKLQAEADELPEGPIGYDSLEKLPYALQVFKEALRLYPPVPVFDRQAQEEITVGGVRVPKNGVIMVSPFALQHRESLYPNPERFDPERFTEENEAKRDKHAFIPFGGGPRTCIGNFFAMMEGQIALAELARKFTFEALPGRSAQMSRVGLLKPKDGVWVKVKKRAVRRFLA